MVFSDTTLKQGILEQVRSLMRVDSTQYPTAKIVASVNNWLDTITGYAIGADRRFQWDDTNHSKLPIGTTNMVSGQSDYSFLTDEQGNSIITLTRIDMLLNETTDTWTTLKLIDQNDRIFKNVGLQQAFSSTGTPEYYDKIADNIIRLYATPNYSKTNGLKFYFQRTPSYFVATDTTKAPGVSPLLHRGFVIASAYDGAITLGLNNIQALGIEKQLEEKKMMNYFNERNQDDTPKIMKPKKIMYI
jgi:hypothetical protein